MYTIGSIIIMINNYDLILIWKLTSTTDNVNESFQTHWPDLIE